MVVERRGISVLIAERGWLTRLLVDGSSEPFTRSGDEVVLTPDELAICADGAVLVLERGRHRVVKVRTDGVVELYAGTGFAGRSVLGRLAIETELDCPHSIAVLRDGSTVIADYGNDRYIRVTTDGVAVDYATSDIRHPRMLSVDFDGSVFLEGAYHNVARRGLDGEIKEFDLGDLQTRDFVRPTKLRPASDGSLLIDVSNYNHQILRLHQGKLAEVAGKSNGRRNETPIASHALGTVATKTQFINIADHQIFDDGAILVLDSTRYSSGSTPSRLLLILDDNHHQPVIDAFDSARRAHGRRDCGQYDSNRAKLKHISASMHIQEPLKVYFPSAVATIIRGYAAGGVQVMAARSALRILAQKPPPTPKDPNTGCIVQ
jgi:hypothetical protein